MIQGFRVYASQFTVLECHVSAIRHDSGVLPLILKEFMQGYGPGFLGFCRAV